MNSVTFAVIALLAVLLLLENQAHAVAVGQPCGGTTGATCDRGLWCEPPTGMCASTAGTCVAVPRLCIARKKSKSFKPVCGCNRKTYSSDCFRRAYKVVKFRDGKCEQATSQWIGGQQSLVGEEDLPLPESRLLTTGP
jgi:hypothetical protein